MDKVKFGLKLKKLRTEKKLTQEEFSQMLCICDKSLSRIEAGRTYPRLNSIISLSKALGVSVDYLICDETEINEDIYITEIHNKIKDMPEITLKHILKYIELLADYCSELSKSKRDSDNQNKVNT